MNPRMLDGQNPNLYTRHSETTGKAEGFALETSGASGWLWHSCGQFSLMTYGAAAHRPFDEKPTTVET